MVFIWGLIFSLTCSFQWNLASKYFALLWCGISIPLMFNLDAFSNLFLVKLIYVDLNSFNQIFQILVHLCTLLLAFCSFSIVLYKLGRKQCKSCHCNALELWHVTSIYKYRIFPSFSSEYMSLHLHVLLRITYQINRKLWYTAWQHFL